MNEESNEQEQALNVHEHHKEVNEEPESPKTFEPQPIGPEFTPVPVKKRKLKKWMIVVIVLLVLVIAAGAGVFYLVNNKKPASEKAKTPASSKTANTKSCLLYTSDAADE